MIYCVVAYILIMFLVAYLAGLWAPYDTTWLLVAFWPIAAPIMVINFVAIKAFELGMKRRKKTDE